MLQGVCVRHRQYVFVTDSLGFSEIVCVRVDGMFATQKVFVFQQKACFSHRQCVSITDSRYLPQKVYVCHRQSAYVTAGISISQTLFLNVLGWHVDKFVHDI